MQDNTPIQSLGGKARAQKLSAAELSAQGSKAALARWAARPLRATHKGNFQKDFGVDVDCYVLDDANKTAVIVQTGMARALGLSEGGNVFPRFLTSQVMSAAVGDELRSKLAQPIKFQWAGGGAEMARGTMYGFDGTILIELCQAIVRAEASGQFRGSRHRKVIAQAAVILSASAKAGIKNLLYALAGYNPTAVEVIEAFKLYVQEEAKKYEKEFPPELYAEWYRLYKIPAMERGRPWHFKRLTVSHVYYPLAKSNGKILDLVRAAKATGGDRRDKLFQFLNEIGTRALRFHLGRLVEMAQDSGSRQDYEEKVLRRFGGEEQLNFLDALQGEPPEPAD